MFFSVDSAEESSVTILFFLSVRLPTWDLFLWPGSFRIFLFVNSISFSKVASVVCPHTDIFIHSRKLSCFADSGNELPSSVHCNRIILNPY